jgi:CRP-like cAMP-binding protein
MQPHAIEQRMRQWLLLIHDWIPIKERPITKAFLAQMLAVCPERVTRAARALLKVGLIRCDHDHITIVDRRILEARA